MAYAGDCGLGSDSGDDATESFEMSLPENDMLTDLDMTIDQSVLKK